MVLLWHDRIQRTVCSTLFRVVKWVKHKYTTNRTFRMQQNVKPTVLRVMKKKEKNAVLATCLTGMFYNVSFECLL